MRARIHRLRRSRKPGARLTHTPTNEPTEIIMRAPLTDAEQQAVNESAARVKARIIEASGAIRTARSGASTAPQTGSGTPLGHQCPCRRHRSHHEPLRRPHSHHQCRYAPVSSSTLMKQVSLDCLP